MASMGGPDTLMMLLNDEYDVLDDDERCESIVPGPMHTKAAYHTKKPSTSDVSALMDEVKKLNISLEVEQTVTARSRETIQQMESDHEALKRKLTGLELFKVEAMVRINEMRGTIQKLENRDANMKVQCEKAKVNVAMSVVQKTQQEDAILNLEKTIKILQEDCKKEYAQCTTANAALMANEGMYNYVRTSMGAVRKQCDSILQALSQRSLPSVPRSQESEDKVDAASF